LTRLLLCSGREGRDVEDLELDSIWVVEKHCVVPGQVGVLLRLALEQRAVLPQPVRALVDGGAGAHLDREMMQPDAIAVVLARIRLRRAQPDGAVTALEVPDRLAALALDLADPVPAEPAQQL